MTDLAEDTIAADVTADLVATLAAATVTIDTVSMSLFSSVTVAKAEKAFARTANVLKDSRPLCGLIVPQPEWADSDDNGDGCAKRLMVSVVMGFYSPRSPGRDDAAAVTVMQQLAGYVRRALLADRSRGGRIGLVKFKGEMIDGTEVRGAPRLLSDRANEGFYFAVLPVACAWAASE